jgi:hypothetical protein
MGILVGGREFWISPFNLSQGQLVPGEAGKTRKPHFRSDGPAPGASKVVSSTYCTQGRSCYPGTACCVRPAHTHAASPTGWGTKQIESQSGGSCLSSLALPTPFPTPKVPSLSANSHKCGSGLVSEAGDQ